MRRTTIGGLAVAAILLLLPTSSAGAAQWLDIPYKTIGGETLKLDVYTPTTGSGWPSVVVVHGGGWDDRKDWFQMGQDFAANGYAAFVIEYRLAPTWTFPAPVEDVRDAALWVEQNAATYGADPSRLAYFGGSAGGQLSLAAALGAPKPDAIVSYSGLTDLPELGSDPLSTQIVKYMGCGLTTCRSKWEDGSAWYRADASFPPTFLANATEEKIPEAQAEKMGQKLSSLGVPNRVQLVPGVYHSQQLHPYVGAAMYSWLGSIFAAAPGPKPSPSPSPTPTPGPTPSSPAGCGTSFGSAGYRT